VREGANIEAFSRREGERWRVFKYGLAMGLAMLDFDQIECLIWLRVVFKCMDY
jgi:hypothetical protein